MAKLVVTEVYEGTNEEIETLQNRVAEIVRSGAYKQNVGNLLQEIETDADYDEEEVEEEETLSERLSRELELLRPVLSRKAIKLAERLIAEAQEAEEDEEDYDDECDCDECNEDYDDEDDCDCDDESQQGIVIRIVVL